MQQTMQHKQAQFWELDVQMQLRAHQVRPHPRACTRKTVLSLQAICSLLGVWYLLVVVPNTTTTPYCAPGGGAGVAAGADDAVRDVPAGTAAEDRAWRDHRGGASPSFCVKPVVQPVVTRA